MCHPILNPSTASFQIHPHSMCPDNPSTQIKFGSPQQRRRGRREKFYATPRLGTGPKDCPKAEPPNALPKSGPASPTWMIEAVHEFNSSVLEGQIQASMLMLSSSFTPRRSSRKALNTEIDSYVSAQRTWHLRSMLPIHRPP